MSLFLIGKLRTSIQWIKERLKEGGLLYTQLLLEDRETHYWVASVKVPRSTTHNVRNPILLPPFTFSSDPFETEYGYSYRNFMENIGWIHARGDILSHSEITGSCGPGRKS